MKKENLKELTRMELLVFQSEVISKTPEDIELQEQIYEEMKRIRKNE